MPTPSKGEKKKDFMKRCMEMPEMVSNYPDSKQRYAVCNSKWDQKHSALANFLKLCGWSCKQIGDLIKTLEK